MQEQVVRIGYIGAGNFSRLHVLPRLSKVPGVQLAVVANRTAESSARVAEQFGFQRVAGDWRGVVEAPDIDAIVMGTRTDAHHDMALPILAAGKHLLTMNAVARTTEEAQDMARAAAARPDLVALIYPGQFYLREDALVRHYLEGELYVGRVLQVVDRWHTPFFGLASQFEVILRWFGDHRRMIGHRKSFGFEVPGRGGAMTRAEANTVVAELVSDGIVLYEHNNATGTFGETCIDVSGSEGRLVCYPVGQRQEVVYGAKKGEQELKPLPVPEHLQDSLANGVPIEADFIAAVRGDHSPSPSIPRFQDGVKLMSFADAWRQSATTSTWCDLSS